MSKVLKKQIEITERKIKQLEDKMTPDTHFSLIDELELKYCKNNLKYLKALELMKTKECCISQIKGKLDVEDEYNYYLFCVDELNYCVKKEQILTKKEFKIVRSVLNEKEN